MLNYRFSRSVAECARPYLNVINLARYNDKQDIDELTFSKSTMTVMVGMKRTINTTLEVFLGLGTNLY